MNTKQKWWAWHKDNPHVFELFCDFTSELINAGHKNYSAKGVFERIRWHTDVDTSGTFKLSNNYTPYYARLFHHYHPEHSGFFRLKKTKEEK